MDAKRLLSRMTAAEHAYLRKLADAGLVDFAAVEAVINEIVADRIGLAREFLQQARSFGLATPGSQRRTISACYYTQYHAGRAVLLFSEKVDRDDHDKMPKFLETVFPGRAIGRALDQMRTRRRSVDYDPYLDFDLAAESRDALNTANTFLEACEAFLKAAGVPL
jgi:uncharacterized protein (UPF0332 family)